MRARDSFARRVDHVDVKHIRPQIDTDKHRISKNFSEVVHDAIFDGAQFSLATKQLFHRSHWFTFAGDYQIEVTEIGVYVERKAVSSNPTRDVHADRRDLPALGVNTSQTLDAKCVDTKV